jgi:putative membrane protein
MERKLYYGIATPGGLLTVGCGLWLWLGYGLGSGSGWLHAKLILVAALIGYHLFCARLVYLFSHDRNQRSHVFYRWFNEVPVLILVAVIVLAVVKPL